MCQRMNKWRYYCGRVNGRKKITISMVSMVERQEKKHRKGKTIRAQLLFCWFEKYFWAKGNKMRGISRRCSHVIALYLSLPQVKRFCNLLTFAYQSWLFLPIKLNTSNTASCSETYCSDIKLHISIQSHLWFFYLNKLRHSHFFLIMQLTFGTCIASFILESTGSFRKHPQGYQGDW